LFPIVFGLFNVLIAVFAFDQCFRRSTLVADPLSLISTQQWLFFKRRREFRRGEVQELFAKVGLRSGRRVYHDLKARLQTGNEITVASSLASKPEADWLVAELNRALGRGP
jgi:hypothetical protein